MSHLNPDWFYAGIVYQLMQIVVENRLLNACSSSGGGCHYFLPCPQLPPQPLRGLLPILLLGEQSHDGCEQFA